MIKPIGEVRSPYKEKFAIPRQPHFAPSIKAQVIIPHKNCAPESFEGLDSFTFIWLVSLFHQAKSNSSKVRPPRLGGNKKIGTFATRSPFRPNPIGLSLVKLIAIERDDQKRQTILRIEGVDLVDQTPILDIKPFIPEHDSPWEKILQSWVDEFPSKTLTVSWSEKAQSFLHDQNEIMAAVEEVLRLDPRPAFHEDEAQKKYHCRLFQYDFHFSVENDQVIIFDVTVSNV